MTNKKSPLYNSIEYGLSTGVFQNSEREELAQSVEESVKDDIKRVFLEDLKRTIDRIDDTSINKIKDSLNSVLYSIEEFINE